MSKTIQIYCRNIGRYIDTEGGDTLADIAAALSPGLGFSPICALVNNKTEHLGFQVFAPKEVEFLDARLPVGREVYVRSLCMIL